MTNVEIFHRDRLRGTAEAHPSLYLAHVVFPDGAAFAGGPPLPLIIHLMYVGVRALGEGEGSYCALSFCLVLLRQKSI